MKQNRLIALLLILAIALSMVACVRQPLVGDDGANNITTEENESVTSPSTSEPLPTVDNSENDKENDSDQVLENNPTDDCPDDNGSDADENPDEDHIDNNGQNNNPTEDDIETNIPDDEENGDDTSSDSTDGEVSVPNQPNDTGDSELENQAPTTDVDQPDVNNKDNETEEIPPQNPQTPPSEHKHSYVVKVTSPTCTTPGFTTYTCSCGHKYKSDDVKATGHSYTKKVIAPTCTADGYTQNICKCGDQYKSNIAKSTGHKYGSWQVVKSTPLVEYLERKCSSCKKVETKENVKAQLDEHIVAYYVVVDGKVIDLVSGKEMSGATVKGEYFTGGKVKLPKNYSNWTYQMIVDYNEKSTAGIIKWMQFVSNSGKYEECGDIFRLDELSLVSNRGSVRIPWVKDSWNHGYDITIPVQLYAHISTNYEYLPSGDTFWSFSMDSDNGILNARINGATSSATMSTYKDAGGNTKYVDKILTSSFTFTNEHLLKEVIIYDRAQSIGEQKAEYEKTGIKPPKSGINEIVDGITGLGSSLYFSKDANGNIISFDSETKKGTYTVTGENGLSTSYTISDYIHPDLGIDNSKYESVHITNEPSALHVGKQYPLTAYPYPFNIIGADGKADQFDVQWKSSNNDIAIVIDGLIIAKKAGTVKITATLTGTKMSDTVTIKIENPPQVKKKTWNVPSNYKSAKGDYFSSTDYKMTTRAIYAAIDYAKANGYNHIVFPKQNFYAQPITDSQGYALRYYVPSNMTIEFPKGSVFYMMDNEVSRGDPTKIEIHYFEFGVKNNDYEGACENSHLIMDTYYGERYKTSHKETEFLEEMRFVNIGRKAINCSVEIRNAYYTTGYFIVVDGTSSTNRTSGVMKYGDFVSGWLNDKGEIQSDSNWISTTNFITVPNYGKDGYFISADGQESYAGKYWGGCAARQYDILWYNANKTIIQIDRFQGRGEYYAIPNEAAYFKVSLQQSDLPVPGNKENANSPWLAMHDDGSAKMCEIKNTKVWNTACGIFSVVGQTDGLWVHHCYTEKNGVKPGNERTGDFENGWLAMRHSVVSNCMLNGYFGNPGGFNTFFHTNFITNYSGFTGETEMLRYINNTTDYVEISEKSQAHIFYNTLYTTAIDRFSKSIGRIYTANNKNWLCVRAY